VGTDVTRLRTVVTTPHTDVSISSALSYVPARMNVPVTRSVRTTGQIIPYVLVQSDSTLYIIILSERHSYMSI